MAAAFVLKYTYGRDALAASAEMNGGDTLDLLFKWADCIILMQEKFRPVVPVEHQEKVRVVDVGEDQWVNPSHPHLLAVVAGKVGKLLIELEREGR